MSAYKIIGIVIGIILAIVIAGYVVLKFLGKDKLKIDFAARSGAAPSGDDASADKMVTKRLKGLGLFSGGVIAVLMGRLWAMQLVSTDDYKEKAESNRTRTILTPAPRGRILDRNGIPLVDNRPCPTVTATPEVIKNPVEIQLLSNLLGMPQMAVRRKIQDQSEGAQAARTIAIDVPRRIIAYLGGHSDVFKGVDVEERTQRDYPYGNLAAHVLGYTGPVTKEQLDASKQKHDEGQVSYSIGDIVGQAGVELQYESVLQGVRGEQKVHVDVDGHVVDYGESIPGKSGNDVVLTIDKNIQLAAQRALKHAIHEAHLQGNPQCKSGAAIVIDVRDGSIIACASEPSFSPSVFIGGISNQDWEKLSDEKSGYPLLNKAISGQFPAASTIKPLSAFAGLNYGMCTPGSNFYCSGFWTGMGKDHGKKCWNEHGHGDINLQDGITYSCDVVFYEIAKNFFNSKNPEGLQETYREWGLEKPTGVDLPAEAKGRIPDAKWKWDTYTSSPDVDRRWQGGDTANIVIGQGDFLVTAIQMAEVYAGLATHGKQYKPHVLKEVKTQSSSTPLVEFQPEIYNETSEKPEYYNVVDNGLLGVIEKEEPHITAEFSSIPVRVAGKTGTGERPPDIAPTAWFCCYAPYEDPKYVVAVVLENAGFGGTTAMYAARDIMAALFKPDDKEEQNRLAAYDNINQKNDNVSN